MFIVTGATGFIGSAMVWELNQRGIKDIIVVDEYGAGPKWKNLSKRQFLDFVPKDRLFDFLTHFDNANDVIAVFHMGANSSTAEVDVDHLMDVNYGYSKEVFKWCAHQRKTLVYASSCATYGDGALGFDDGVDSNLLRPLNPYGYSKVLFDRWTLQQPKVPPHWLGLKFSNVFGPQEYHKGEQSSVAFKAFSQIRDSGRLKLFKSHLSDYKDGEQKRDFVYIKDVTQWMWFLAHHHLPSGVYNMGSGQARSWLDLARAAFQSAGRKLEIEWIDIPVHLREHYQYFTEAKMDKLLAHGLSRPIWTLESGIEDYYKNYLSTPDPYL